MTLCESSSESASESALDALLWGESEPLSDDERDFWRYLCRAAKPYPRGEFIPPFRRPSGPARQRAIVGARLGLLPSEQEGHPTPAMLWTFGDGCCGSVVLDGTDSDVGHVAQALFTKPFRSRLIVFLNGAKRDLRVIAQRWGLALDELGFTVELMVNGGKLRAIIVKRGKHRWYLCDWESLTGRPPDEMHRYAKRHRWLNSPGGNPASALYYAVCYVQWWLKANFGVGLSLTIGGTALRAAARSLPEEVWKWRPLPLLVSLCRIGRAFRGGAVRGNRYRGPAWLIDLNRAYTAALGAELPLRAGLGRCVREGRERPGVYVCRVRGPARSLIYVAWWNAAQSCVELGWRSDPDGRGFLSVLPSSEWPGLRALGYTVEPTIGLVFTRTFTFGSFVERIAATLRQHGTTSPEGKLTKLIGNSVYGKFASDPTRRTVRLAKRRPGLDWYVWVDSDGWPVEDVWEQNRISYQWSQHIDVASFVTARVRSRLYETQAQLGLSGLQVIGIQTDSLTVNGDPSKFIDGDNDLVGGWKIDVYDPLGVIVGANCYSIGSKSVVPDHPSPSRADVVALFERCDVELDTEKRGHPRPCGPMFARVHKRISAPPDYG